MPDAHVRANRAHELALAESPAIPGLLGTARRHQAIGMSNCTVHLVSYDRQLFRPASFQDAGIRMPQEIARSVPARMAEFFFGRLAARLALDQWGLKDHDIGIGDLRQPLFPAQVVGAITHTRTVAAATALPAAHRNGVGIDIEEPIPADMIQGVEETILCSSELALLRQHGGIDYPTLLALVFSAKESFYKAVSKSAGQVLEYRVLRLNGIDASRCRLQFITTEQLSSSWPGARMCEIDYALLACGAVLTAFAW